MEIKNLTSRTLKLRRTGKKNIFITPGKNDYPVSLRDKGDAVRLQILRDANLIAFEGEIQVKKEAVEDVRNIEETIATTGTNRNTDTVDRGISRSKANKSR